MGIDRQPNREQATLWNSTGARAWIDMQPLLDQTYQGFEELLVAAVKRGRVLDVGCGTGGTTLAVARSLGSKGQCVGVDISEPMIALARARAEQDGTTAEFISADAQNYAFEPASVDVFISRFGVMFFDDPVKAFTNLRRAASEHAELRLIAWRGAEENPFMTTAERGAGPLLSNIPARVPNAPGQFAFADPHRVKRILEESGWTEVVLQPIDVPCAFPDTELVRHFTQLGPLGRVLDEADEAARTRIIETVRAAFDPYVHGDEIRFNAACWMINARAT